MLNMAEFYNKVTKTVKKEEADSKTTLVDEYLWDFCQNENNPLRESIEEEAKKGNTSIVVYNLEIHQAEACRKMGFCVQRLEHCSSAGIISWGKKKDASNNEAKRHKAFLFCCYTFIPIAVFFGVVLRLPMVCITYGGALAIWYITEITIGLTKLERGKENDS